MENRLRKIVSVSLGSSSRDKTITTRILDHDFMLQRIGCDGKMNRVLETLRELDGKVDAFGLGGIDLYLFVDRRRYEIRDGVRLAAAAAMTPVFDGSYLKNTLEYRVVQQVNGIPEHCFSGKKVLIMSALDRPGMARGFSDLGCDVLFGDGLFALGLPLYMHSYRTLSVVARILLPVVSRLPFSWIYPTGERQEKRNPRFTKVFDWADVIAGDFLYIRRYMPDRLPGKTLLTNTTTAPDVEFLREAGVKTLITTTPEYDGRSFGTNVMEAAIAIATGMDVRRLSFEAFDAAIERIGLAPGIRELN